MSIVEDIIRLKEEKNAVILAHYYVDEEVQDIADYIGDSFYLSKVATKTDADRIIFCGVEFMGESAKILNPDKRVFMPDATADCRWHIWRPGRKSKRSKTSMKMWLLYATSIRLRN